MTDLEDVECTPETARKRLVTELKQRRDKIEQAQLAARLEEVVREQDDGFLLASARLQPRSAREESGCASEAGASSARTSARRSELARRGAEAVHEAALSTARHSARTKTNASADDAAPGNDDTLQNSYALHLDFPFTNYATLSKTKAIET